jgi:hypothetical protein
MCNGGNPEYTRTNIKQGTIEEDSAAWDCIYDSYILEFGLGKEYLRVLEIRKDIALYQCDLVISDDRFLNNKIKRLQRELEEILSKPVEGDVTTCMIHLSKWIGYRINEREVTVLEFYKMLKEYQKEIEANKKHGK